VSADRTALGGDVPDAGTEQKRHRGEGVDEVGAIVVDADDDSDDRDPAVVVNRPPVSCSEWHAYGDTTVAEDNPAYDADDHVVVVAFRHELEAAHPEWDATGALSLPLECPAYAFPPRRLRRVGHVAEDDAPEDGAGEETDPTDRLTDAQERLRERLEETAEVDVRDSGGEAVLVVEKLGAEHTIDADGSVEGGPVADRLADVAAEYLGGEGR
jgi:hypothetical protein